MILENQLSFFDAIIDLLYLKPIFLLGLIIISVLCVLLLRKNNKLPRIKIVISSFLMYYYLCLLLKNIVGIPTLKELFRVSQLGEPLFNPNISLILFRDGLSLSFVLNILLFIPLGFLSPMISRTYEQVKKDLLLGFGLSLIVEISQLFTLYRATDINDLITNILGTLVGYMCFKLFVKLKFVKGYSEYSSTLEKDSSRFLPIMIIAFAFIIIFIGS